jgi:hypothetical protein
LCTYPQLRACWLLVDEILLEARLRVDTAFYQGCEDVERLIRPYLAWSRWANDRVRRAATHAAGVVIHMGADDMVESVATQCVQRLRMG